jgi:putative transposase
MKHQEKVAVTDSQILDEVIDTLLAHIDLPMQGSFTKENLFEVLVRAATTADTVEHTSKLLTDVPNGNDIRYHLNKLNNIKSLTNDLNEALQSRIPPRLENNKLKLAIDLNLIPYYGEPTDTELPYIYRSQAKSGTCSFYAYATLYVISKGKRITLALHPVERTETMVCTITHLLDRLSPLNITPKMLYLDRGFYSVPVIRWLQLHDIPFVMPVIVRGKKGGTRAIVDEKKTYKTPYTMKSNDYGIVTFQIWVVGKYSKGKHGRHGVEYMAFVVHKVPISIRALPEDYRSRFGIETNYRLKNLSRIRTTTKKPAIRLLFVGIAFLLTGLWVYILWTHVSTPRKGGRKIHAELLQFRTMLEFLRQAVDSKYRLRSEVILLQ